MKGKPEGSSDDYGEEYWGGLISDIKKQGILGKARSLIQKIDRRLLVGGIAVLAVGIIGGAYYIHSKNNLDTSAYTTEVPSDSPSSSPTPSDTSLTTTNGDSTDNNQAAIPTPTQTPSISSSLSPDASHSTFSASPSSIPADGSSSTTLTITLENSLGSPLAGATVSLAAPSDSKAVFKVPTTSTTNSSGQVTFTMSSSNAGTDSIDVTSVYQGISKTLTGLGSVTFNFLGSPSPTPSSGVVDQGRSSVVATPDTVFANGTSASTIIVTLKDGLGNPISGKTVSLAQTSGLSGTNISPATASTDASGEATFSVTSNNTSGGTSVFTATDSSDSVVLTNTASVIFQAPSPSPS